MASFMGKNKNKEGKNRKDSKGEERKGQSADRKSKFKIMDFRSIRSQLVVYFTILLLASTAIIGYISIKRSSEALVEAAISSVTLAGVEASDLTESRVETQMRTLEMIALRDDIQSMNWEEQQPVLMEQLPRIDFHNLAIVDLKGQANFTDGS